MERKLKILLDYSSKIANEKDLRNVLLFLTDLAKEIMEADRCSIFLYDDQKKTLWTIVAHGVDRIEIDADKGIAGYVFRTGEILNIPDAYKDPRFDRDIDKRTGYRTRTILAVPLFDRKQNIIGVFQVINKLTNSVFTEEDIELLRHISLYASSTIENAILYEKLKKAHEDVIYRLSHATKFKDPETQNHIIRVGLYCEILAREAGLDEEDVELVKLAAPMHDIGKVGIPDRVLLKPGKLNDEEWEIMKKHTIYGYEILKGGDSRLLQIAADIAIEHHERWDGTGYPFGKKGEEISIYGRMTSISDVFDALTSDRPYKKAWDMDRTVRFFKEQKGKHFDPFLTDIFLKNIDQMFSIKRELRDED
ncbi:MAG TPA: HD domain-containing protein [Persephonella sp.]|uniref:Metal dependent phosphohydrolase n=1 Tax=Persephonella marina (strain DSM 14350 / EX-H1) TaxID=123214 RepID=C0QQ26_PERMH|nr:MULTISPECIES: HD domain-containing phosphohydrolase [Persephonella]ACO03551.1 metal dependent phosphohydrolase [Persephonella marina EX-H1]HCB69613.1 HD domain-containing protein [Persephonella sp.]